LADLPRANKERDRVAIITQGTLPTIVVVSGKEISEYPVYEISKSEINNINIASDPFARGFVAGLVEGKPLAECVDNGWPV
jgi:adenosine kinase